MTFPYQLRLPDPTPFLFPLIRLPVIPALICYGILVLPVTEVPPSELPTPGTLPCVDLFYYDYVLRYCSGSLLVVVIASLVIRFAFTGC